MLHNIFREPMCECKNIESGILRIFALQTIHSIGYYEICTNLT